LRCKVCSREVQSQSEYCELHEKAYQNIREKFEVWNKASGVGWKEYLREIAKNPLTGTWVREVAENLISKEV